MKNVKDFLEKHPDGVTLPDGGVLIPLSLPATSTARWTARRKAEVVAAVEAGMLTIPDACRRYRLSPEEYLEWERHYKAGDWLLASAPRTRRALH
jgi:hypothetical protein